MQTWLCFCLQFFQRYFLLCDASTGYKVKHRQEVLSLKKKGTKQSDKQTKKP